MNLYRNDKLRAAFDLYVRRQDALLPTEEELSSITLSPEFHARMTKLLTRRKRGYYHMFGTWGRRVATILIALLVATTTVTFSVKALREKVIEFFAEVFDTHTAVTFVDNEQNVLRTAMEIHAPTYIPEGYMVEEEMTSTIAYEVIYVNDEGSGLVYTQRWKDNNVMVMDTENVQTCDIFIDTYHGIGYTNKGINFIVFTDAEYVYTFSGTLSMEELVKIGESVLEN